MHTNIVTDFLLLFTISTTLLRRSGFIQSNYYILYIATVHTCVSLWPCLCHTATGSFAQFFYLLFLPFDCRLFFFVFFRLLVVVL